MLCRVFVVFHANWFNNSYYIFNYFILDILRIVFSKAFANKSRLLSSNDENKIDVWILFLRVKKLELKKTSFISFELLINESINENTQTIINQLFLEKLSISKKDSFYVDNLVLIINDHKTWTRIVNTMFQHQVQKLIVYEWYKWIISFDVLFHLEMNMIELLLINHYDSTKSKKSTNHFHLKTHVEFWDRKKTRSNNWDFHVAQELIL
jgi:hypothetical protein